MSLAIPTAAVCPCCGQSMPGRSALAISDDGTVVIPGGPTLHLRNQQVELLALLWKKMPGLLRYGEIYARLWDVDKEPEGADKTIKVYISQLRSALAGTNFKIENESRRGYRMFRTDAPRSHVGHAIQVMLEAARG
jgi:DNA-binding response OmpR family regulator